MRNYYVYIMGNSKPTLYIGVTNNLIKRIYEHRQEFTEGFTKQYHLKKLLYFEMTTSIEEALKREKQLKNWHRDWKLNLIQKQNPAFKDLYETLL